jgi:pyrophosphatase PpaX
MQRLETLRVPERRFDIALFDLDGTIADTLPLIYEAFNAAFVPSLGAELTPLEIRSLFGPPDHEIIRRRVPAEAADDAIARYNRYYEGHHDALAGAYPGIPDLVRRCADAGIRLGLITGKSRLTALITLDRLDLRWAFGAIYAGDDVERQKPDPEAIRLALRDLGASSTDRAVMIGDAAADVIAGRAAGVATIGVGWGSPDVQYMLDEKPDYVVETVSELEALLVR